MVNVALFIFGIKNIKYSFKQDCLKIKHFAKISLCNISNTFHDYYFPFKLAAKLVLNLALRSASIC